MGKLMNRLEQQLTTEYKEDAEDCIEIMKNNCKIHLITTKYKSNTPFVVSFNDLMAYSLGVGERSLYKEECTFHHIYITDDEEIKYSERDTLKYVVTFNNKVGTIIEHLGYSDFLLNVDGLQEKHGYKDCRKIIATTDESLTIDTALEDRKDVLYDNKLTLISQQDIETIVKLYNDGGNWEDVKVEYFYHYDMNEDPKLHKLKLSPEGNVVLSFEEEHKTVILGKMYSKEKLLGLTMGNSTIVDWIEENLEY